MVQTSTTHARNYTCQKGIYYNFCSSYEYYTKLNDNYITFVSIPVKINITNKLQEIFYYIISENSGLPTKSFEASALKSLTDIENYIVEERGSN